MAEYKLTFGIPDPIVVDSLPLSNWTIVNTNTLSVNGDTVTQLGIGGWYESMFVSFIVSESGSYKISYDYNITTAKIGSHGTYGFGLWLTTNNPNVSGVDQSNFYSNESNRTGSLIGVQNEDISGKHGTVNFNVNLNAGTTYYLWYPGAALDDGTTYTLNFTNIRVYNNPIKYNYDNLLVFNGWNGYISYDADEYVSISLISNATATAYCEATYKGETTAWTSNGTVSKDIPVGATVVFSSVVPKYYRVQNMTNTDISSFTTARGTGSDTNQRIISGSGIITGAGTISTYNTHLNKVYITGTYSTPTSNRQTWFNNNGGSVGLKTMPNITKISQVNGLASGECIGGTLDCPINTYSTTAKNRTFAWRNYTTANGRPDLRGSSAVRNSGNLSITGYDYHFGSEWTGEPSQRGLQMQSITGTGTQAATTVINKRFFKGGSTTGTTRTTSYTYNFTGNLLYTGSTEAYFNGGLGIYVAATMADPGNVSQTGHCKKVPVNQVYNVNGNFIWSGIVP